MFKKIYTPIYKFYQRNMAFLCYSVYKILLKKIHIDYINLHGYCLLGGDETQHSLAISVTLPKPCRKGSC